jgi:hypothetical protein
VGKELLILILKIKIMNKKIKNQLIADLKFSISKNLLAENLTFLQKADFINDAYHSTELFINQSILNLLKTEDKYEGFTLLYTISPSIQEANEIVELLETIQDNLHFVSDTGKVLTYIFNNLEINHKREE